MSDTVERAFQLVRDGSCRSLDDLRRKLKAEGHEGVYAHIAGSLGKQLKAELVKNKLVQERSQDQ